MTQPNAWLVRSIQLAIVASVFLLWHALATGGFVNRWLLPAPGLVVAELLELVAGGTIIPDLATTLYELAAGFMLAAVAGIVMGYLVGRSRHLTASFEPLFAALFAFPVVVIYPLCILYLGLGPASKIAFGALHGFFPIVLATIVGFATVDRRLVEAARSMGASQRQMLALVLLPAALPIVLSGVRMGLTLTFLAVIAGETLGALSGLGHKIVWAAEAMDSALMFAYILIVVGVATLLYAALSRLESRRVTEAGR